MLKPVYRHALFSKLGTLYNNEDVCNASSDIPHAGKQPLPQFNAKILVVEDFIPNQQIITDILELMGCYEITCVTDGIKAINELEKNAQEYDLVFMDYQMPEMDGVEATKTIRSKSWGKELKIIAMTAAAVEGDKQLCLDAGMDDYIEKPVRIKKVSDMMEEYLGKE